MTPRRRRWPWAVALAAVLVIAPVAAAAFVSRAGAGSIQATADTVPAGAQPATSVQGRNVQLRWAPSRFGDGTSMTSYAVAGTHPTAAPLGPQTCGAGIEADGLVTGCGFARLAPGAWQFTVTPSFGSWTGGPSAAQSVSIPAPTITASPATTTAGGAVVVRTQSFLDAQTVTLRWATTSGAVLGSVVTAADGTSETTVSVPATVANGTYALFATGDQGDVASLPIKIANKPRNTAPVAVDDDRLGVGGFDIAVVANDTDADGDPLVVTAVSRPRSGVASIQPGGRTVRYVAFSGYRGEDSFTYDVSDGHGGTARATVRVVSGSAGVSGTFGLSPFNVVSTGGSVGETVDATNPIFVRWTSPVRVPFQLLVVGPVVGRTAGWVVGGQNVRALAAPTSAVDPYRLFFRVEAPAAAKGGKKPAAPPATTEVVFNGTPVPACTDPFGTAADPDPCVAANRYDAASNDYLVSVRSSRAG